MKQHISKLLIFTGIIICCYACKQPRKIRTVYWSGSTYIRNDSMPQPNHSYYLAYYIEVSDTGPTRLMNREKFKAEKKFYLIQIRDSLKNNILNLASSQNSLYKSKKRDGDYAIYDGLCYNLRYEYDSIFKSVTFIPEFADSLQMRLYHIFEGIRNNPLILKQAHSDLTAYQKITAQNVFKYMPPPPIKGWIKFTPAVVHPDMNEMDTVPPTNKHHPSP